MSFRKPWPLSNTRANGVEEGKSEETEVEEAEEVAMGVAVGMAAMGFAREWR